MKPIKLTPKELYAWNQCLAALVAFEVSSKVIDGDQLHA